MWSILAGRRLYEGEQCYTWRSQVILPAHLPGDYAELASGALTCIEGTA
jgi:hypothetical protein